MLYRLLDDLTEEPAPPPDTADMAEAGAAVSLGERHQAVLTRLVELGMDVAEAIAAQTRQEGAAEAGAAFAKVSQAIRRTIDLQDRLARDLRPRRGDLAERRRRRASEAGRAHYDAREREIMDGIEAAIGEARDDDKEAAEALREVENLLDSDRFADYEERPVGETIARLCQALGLDPDWCVQSGAGWAIKADTPADAPANMLKDAPLRPGLIELDPKAPPAAKSTPRAPSKPGHAKLE